MSAERVILITGAARGIGRAMARHLAGPETLLLLHYRSSRAGAEALAREAEAKGSRVELVTADLAVADERERMMEQVAELSPVLHVLINNVGIYDGSGLLEFTPEKWSGILEGTCSAVFHITLRALPLLRQGVPARVINLGDSSSDHVGARPQATPYHIAKLGVHVLTRSFAKLLGSDGITVNQISPGFLENSTGEPASPIPVGRKGLFKDITPALDYLLSPDAEYVTGANIVISGGWNL